MTSTELFYAGCFLEGMLLYGTWRALRLDTARRTVATYALLLFVSNSTIALAGLLTIAYCLIEDGKL